MKLGLYYLLILYLFVLSSGCSRSAHSDKLRQASARRYIDMFELNPASSADNQITEKYSLLERKEVQLDMSLSDRQVEAARNAFTIKTDDIPGVSEFIVNSKKKGEPVIPGVLRITKAYYEKKLLEILTPIQVGRLDQLWMQMRGPVVLLTTNLVDVGLTVDQQSKILAISSEHLESIKQPLQEFGRNFIGSYPSNISNSDKKKLMDKLAVRCENAIKTRDQAILDILSTEQKEKLQNAFGRSLYINWNSYGLMHRPFALNDIMELK